MRALATASRDGRLIRRAAAGASQGERSTGPTSAALREPWGK
jgi:hypothetical protein